ncbi:MAG: hypothetical protein R3E91_05360 [Chlamydiales bacterium]
MHTVHQITCHFPCCQNSQSAQTNLSIGLRVTAVAIGTILAIGGSLILSNVPGIGSFGHPVGWAAISTSVVLVPIGICIKCVKNKVLENQSIVDNQPIVVTKKQIEYTPSCLLEQKVKYTSFYLSEEELQFITEALVEAINGQIHHNSSEDSMKNQNSIFIRYDEGKIVETIESLIKKATVTNQKKRDKIKKRYSLLDDSKRSPLSRNQFCIGIAATKLKKYNFIYSYKLDTANKGYWIQTESP